MREDEAGRPSVDEQRQARISQARGQRLRRQDAGAQQKQEGNDRRGGEGALFRKGCQDEAAQAGEMPRQRSDSRTLSRPEEGKHGHTAKQDAESVAKRGSPGIFRVEHAA